MSHQQDQNPEEEIITKNPVMDVIANQSDNEVESALRIEEGEQPRSNKFPSFSRQSSVYSLTLDEFQNTLTGSGKNYGSMNMDEFLKSIWTAEENEAQAQNAKTAMPAAPMTSVTNINPQYQFCETSFERGKIARPMSLTRQGSLSMPTPFGKKTVEEVWSKINRTQHSTNNFTHASSNQSYPTYGEMTLEDFLVKAGVVQEESAAPAQYPPPSLQPQLPQLQPQPQPQLQPQPLPQLPYGIYVNCDSAAASSFMVLGCGGAGSVNVPPPFRAVPQIGGANVTGCLPGGMSSVSSYKPANSCYGGGVTDNGCATESFEQMSPVSSDGIGMSKPGRKRMIDGPVERVIERRQKRMIKNRESAARSRARKHVPLFTWFLTCYIYFYCSYIENSYNVVSFVNFCIYRPTLLNWKQS